MKPGTRGRGSRSDPSRAEADRALAARLARGDQRALEAIYDRYSTRAYSLARRILVDGALAEDVVQEVFLALWRDPQRFDADRGNLASFLLAMTHHKAVDAVRREELLRQRRTGEDVLAALEDDAPSPADQVWRAERGQQVRAALGGLPPHQREALALAYYGGYTQREIAGLTRSPIGTVKTRMLAGMRSLRVLLNESGGEVPADG